MLAVASAVWVVNRSHGNAPATDQPASAEQSADSTTDGRPADDQATPDPAAAEPASAVAAETQQVQGEPSPSAPDPPVTAAPAIPTPSPTSSAEENGLAAGANSSKVEAPEETPYGKSGGLPPEPASGSTESAGAAARAMDGDAGEAESFDPVKQARLMSHLQDKLPALEFPGVPLGQFVAFLSEFSTVPMVIDTRSMIEAGKSAKMRVTVKLDDATVEEALRTALDKSGLAFHIEPGRLVITARAAKSK